MKLLLLLSLIVIVYVGTGHGSVTPDSSFEQVSVEQTVASDGTPIGDCLSKTPTFTTRTVRIQELTTESDTTFVRRVVSDEFAACYLEYAQELSASDFLGCAAATENAGLKMFTFMEGNWLCTGYPVRISLEQQGCTGSGTTVFYTTLPTTARANTDTEAESAPVARQEAESAPAAKQEAESAPAAKQEAESAPAAKQEAESAPAARQEAESAPAARQEATQRMLTVSTDVIVNDNGFKGIEGKGLMSAQTYRQLEVINRCQCRYFCSSDSACNAFSVKQLGMNRFLCSLANDNVYTNTPSSVSASYYAIRATELVEAHASDNLIYRVLGTQRDNYEQSKSDCDAIPGFRLVAPRFAAQLPILLELCLGGPPSSSTQDCTNRTIGNWFYVDMKKVTGVTMIRDVLPVSETDLGPHILNNDDNKSTHFYYVYAHSKMLHDENSPHWNSYPVCQANVYGVNW